MNFHKFCFSMQKYTFYGQGYYLTTVWRLTGYIIRFTLNAKVSYNKIISFVTANFDSKTPCMFRVPFFASWIC